jgi:hypothetical protein
MLSRTNRDLITKEKGEAKVFNKTFGFMKNLVAVARGEKPGKLTRAQERLANRLTTHPYYRKHQPRYVANPKTCSHNKGFRTAEKTNGVRQFVQCRKCGVVLESTPHFTASRLKEKFNNQRAERRAHQERVREAAALVKARKAAATA